MRQSSPLEAGLNSSTTRVSGPRGGCPAVSWSPGTSSCMELPLERGAPCLGLPPGAWSSGSGSESTSSSMESYSSLEQSFCSLCRFTLSSRLFLSSCQRSKKVRNEICHFDKNHLKQIVRATEPSPPNRRLPTSSQPMCSHHFEDEKTKGRDTQATLNRTVFSVLTVLLTCLACHQECVRTHTYVYVCAHVCVHVCEWDREGDGLVGGLLKQIVGSCPQLLLQRVLDRAENLHF